MNPDVSRFLHDGRIVSLPRRWEHRRAVARWLAHQVLPDLLEPVPEPELTARIAELGADPVGLRRLLVDLGIVHRTRDGAEYWRTELTEYDDASGRRTFHLDGGRIDSVAAFYDEVNRVFMADEDWPLGQSLDALHDLLHGGIGALRDAGPVAVVWDGFDHSREALGFAATRAWLRGKIEQPQVYDAARFRRELDDLEAGTGKTYLERVLEVFADHPEIRLELR